MKQTEDFTYWAKHQLGLLEFQVLLEQLFITLYIERLIDVPITYCGFTPYS